MTSTATTNNVTAISVGSFHHCSPRYRCCVCCHVRCASFAIGLLQAFGLGSLLINLIIAVSGFDRDATATAYIPTIISSLVFIFCTFCVICLFVGLCKGNPLYLTPMLFMLLISIGYYLLMVIFVIIVFASDSEVLTRYLSQQLRFQGSSFHTESEVKGKMEKSMIVMIVTFSIGVLFDIWWYTVIRRCRVYLKDKQDWNAHHSACNYSAASQAGTTGDASVSLLPQPTRPNRPNNLDVEENISVPPPPAYEEVANAGEKTVV